MLNARAATSGEQLKLDGPILTDFRPERKPEREEAPMKHSRHGGAQT